MRRDRERLLDIKEAIEGVERYASRGKDAAMGDELIRVWIVYHLQTIGEAVRLLTPELKARHPEIAWTKIVGMRNLLVHEYFVVDSEAVWSSVENDLPALKLVIARMLEESK